MLDLIIMFDGNYLFGFDKGWSDKRDWDKHSNYKGINPDNEYLHKIWLLSFP